MLKRFKTTRFTLPVLCALICACATLQANSPLDPKRFDHPIRVACVGDSITMGYGIPDAARNSYPAQLAAMLGDQWQVRNFGVGGTTLLKNGDAPYWKQKALQDALAFAPDVVIIKLGTNDTKPQNWKHGHEYAGDYEALIKQFQSLDSKPRVWICYPVPAFSRGWGISNQVIEDEMMPLISQVAAKTDVPVIDLHSALGDPATMIGDGIHPGARGAGLIAATVYTTLTGRKPPSD